MAKKKRVLDDGDSDSDMSDREDIDFENIDDPDAREEMALFRNPYQRKRRKKGGKEDAIYGVLGGDSDEESRPNRNTKRSDWTKAPAFVSGEKVELDNDSDVDEDRESEDDSNEESKPPSPRVVEEAEEEDEPKSSFSNKGFGLGFGSQAGIGAHGLGFARAESSAPPSEDSTPPPSSMPSAFGKKSFVREQPARPATPLSAAEAAHFSKLQGSFGARMLAKMGWSAGQGLGVGGEGIITPVESKLRPQKMGIAFKGFSERTEQSKREARRKGLDVSDDEGSSTPGAKKAKQLQEKRSDVWKRPKKVKVKVQHKTYEEIVAEAGAEVPSSGVGIIIDATGATPREVSSLSDVNLDTWTPTSDPTRIPEVRHNLRIITDACKSELDGLAREGKSLQERKKWLDNEEVKAAKKVAEEADLIARLQRVNLVAGEINIKSKELSSQYEVSLDPFSPFVYQLSEEFPREIDMYQLDEIIVAAITPLVRRMVANWDPLAEPTLFVSTFRNWRRVLKMSAEEKPRDQVDIYGSTRTVAPTVLKPMTPFESLLWNIILPKFRSAINNDWSPADARPAVKLYEAWSTFLPPFIRDNFLDQLILPKVHKAVAEWKPRKGGVSLQSLVFPWLPHVGLRLEEFIGDARRKIKGVLRNWSPDEDIPDDLTVWKDVFSPEDWDSMLLKYVVPKLGATLRDDFRINPRDQKMEPLEHVLAWSTILRQSIISQLLDTHFFPKWLDVLHIWLIQPKANFEEISQWYTFWKDVFPDHVQNLTTVSLGFTRGLQLMNKAIELGPEARSQLPPPERPTVAPAASKPAVAKKPSTRTHEITFREIVEEFAASHNLLFIPTGRAHERSRMPLYRVSRSTDGKGGLLVYVLDDAVWAPNQGESGDPSSKDFRAITLEDMVLRASA